MSLINILILIPLAGFFVSLFMSKKREKPIARLAFVTTALHLMVALVFTAWWLFNGQPLLNIKDLVLFESQEYIFFIDFGFDKITAVYLIVGDFLMLLVCLYSKNYLHREPGYKRFFNTILFFYLGYHVIIFSGNMETLFIGWEFLGMSSFLLIAFYRDRYFPVRNAIKVFSIYRIGDVGLLLAIWLSHHFWHANITFEKSNSYIMVHYLLGKQSMEGFFICLMIFMAAIAKSAQLPFSSWLPRAMEGPTPSSAIFYGSLSVHLGIFILLKTYPFWEHQIAVRVLIAVSGILTSIIATSTARSQSSIKGQIAYGSIGQIGIIFVEVALGLQTLALIHFAGNAFLRTYQLLVSPSVVSYLIREQFYNFVSRKKNFLNAIPKRLKYTFYMMSIKEWNLENFLYRFYWHPLKTFGKKMDFITMKSLSGLFIPVYFLGLLLLWGEPYIPGWLFKSLAPLIAFVSLVLVLKSFAERKNVFLAWTLLIMDHFFLSLSIAFNESFHFEQTSLYLSGVIISGLLGYYILRKLSNKETHVCLRYFQGHSYERPRLAFLFLVACLGLSGFPITPTFIGEDVVFTHIREDQYIMVLISSLVFLINGLAVIRMYSLIFLGPHIKTYHETAYKSS